MKQPADWQAFVAASTADARCRAWLSLMVGRLPEARTGVVLIESPSDRSYVPVAVWPKPEQEQGQESSPAGRLSAVVESALQLRQSVIKALPEGGTQLAHLLWIDDRIVGVVCLESALDEHEAAPIAQEIHWGAAWLSNLLVERERAEALAAKERLSSILEILAVALRSGQKLQQTLFDLTNALRLQLGCARVAIGLTKQATVRLSALSDAASFAKRSSLTRSYEQAMSEAYDAHDIVASPPLSPKDANAPWHSDLVILSGAEAAMSCPLIVNAHCVGIVTLERESLFAEQDRLWLEAFGALLAPIIEWRRTIERGTLRRLGDDLLGVLGKLFGPRHLTWKAVAIALLGSVALLMLVRVDYRVSAKTVIEGEVQRVVVAPFNGFIGTAHSRAGDEVKAGQILARLDERELRIEEARWKSERDQYRNRLREATAKHDLTGMEVIGAQFRQASAQLALVTGKIKRARLAAPFDGVVVSGDLSQQIGAPVEEGKTLFEVAPLHSYRVILQVDEREIRHVQMGQSGELVMTGIAGEPMPFQVAKITPVATAQEGRNFFRVEADLAEASPRLRPGMEGVGKIEVGRHSLLWTLTHGFGDWLTLWLWTWMP